MLILLRLYTKYLLVKWIPILFKRRAMLFKLTWAESSSELFGSHFVRRLSVCLSVCLSVNFSHFHLLLQNHWADLNQTWHKASLDERDSNEGPRPFPRADNYEIVKIHWQIKLKNLLLQKHWANFNQTWHKASLGEGDSNEGPRPFPRGDNYELAKNTLTKFKNLLLQNHWANFNQT